MAFTWTQSSFQVRVARATGDSACRGVAARHSVVRNRPSTVRASLTTFQSSDFEIRRSIGQLGWVELTDWEYFGDEGAVREARLTQPKTTVQQSEPAVRLYEAKVASGPLRNSRVLLKEFLTPGLQAGETEAARYIQLFGGASETVDADEVPVATMLGGFTGDEAFDTEDFRQRWKASFPSVSDPPKKGSPWLVFRWEGTATAAGFPNYKQEAQFMDRFRPQNQYKRRTGFLRVLMRKTLEAVDFVHQKGVVHRSLGPSSILANTLDETNQGNLEVKIKDFGFSIAVSGLTDEELRRARRIGAVTPFDLSRFAYGEDLYALGYAFLEIVFGSLSTEGMTARTSQQAFKRLFEEVFETNIDGLKDYCQADEAWGRAVDFLDDPNGSGWELLGFLLGNKNDKERLELPSAHKLVQHPFL